MIELLRTTVEVKTAVGKELELDVAKEYAATVAILERVKAENEGQSDFAINDAYYARLVTWFEDEHGAAISVSEAVQLDRGLVIAFDEFKKKLPPLPTSATESDADPQTSQSSTGSSSGITIDELAQHLNSSSEGLGPSLPPNESNDSFLSPQATETKQS